MQNFEQFSFKTINPFWVLARMYETKNHEFCHCGPAHRLNLETSLAKTGLSHGFSPDFEKNINLIIREQSRIWQTNLFFHSCIFCWPENKNLSAAPSLYHNVLSKNWVKPCVQVLTPYLCGDFVDLSPVCACTSSSSI